GTVAGAHANATHLGLLWIDSHSDINTDVSTISGNIHGMPVSAIMGFGNEKLSAIYSEQPKVLPQHVVLFGVRDMDPLEKEIVEKLNIKVFTYDEIMALGVNTALEQAKAYLEEIDKLHISFDLDSMNPELIKGVTVPVASGFNAEDVFMMFDYILENFEVSSIDVVEFNPVYDSDGYTAEFTNSLLQKIKKA
ncbi:MAG: arginase family protein, partial [Oscillospiraceae bacterium]